MEKDEIVKKYERLDKLEKKYEGLEAEIFLGIGVDRDYSRENEPKDVNKFIDAIHLEDIPEEYRNYYEPIEEASLVIEGNYIQSCSNSWIEDKNDFFKNQKEWLEDIAIYFSKDIAKRGIEKYHIINGQNALRDEDSRFNDPDDPEINYKAKIKKAKPLPKEDIKIFEKAINPKIGKKAKIYLGAYFGLSWFAVDFYSYHIEMRDQSRESLIEKYKWFDVGCNSHLCTPKYEYNEKDNEYIIRSFAQSAFKVMLGEGAKIYELRDKFESYTSDELMGPTYKVELRSLRERSKKVFQETLDNLLNQERDTIK